MQSTHRPAGVLPAAAKPRIRRIGVLRLEASDLPDDWQPPSATAASVESLLRIAPRMPTWLLVP